MWMTLIILNWITGTLLLTFALKNTKKQRVKNEELDRQYPAWKRLDKDKFNLPLMYLLASTILIPRFILTFYCAGSCYVWCRIIMVCRDVTKPRPPTRRKMLEKSFNFHAWLWCKVVRINIVKNYPQVDYSMYLGRPTAEQTSAGDLMQSEKTGRGIVSTYVCNHVSGADGPILVAALNGKLSFMAGAFLKNIPIIGYAIQCLGGLFVPRFGSPEDKQAFMDVFAERQITTESGECTRTPMVIFPEGTTSNNTHICKFKTGAFRSLATVTPMCLKYKNSGIDWSTASMNDINVMVFRYCQLGSDTVTLNIYPPFKPNQYLYDTHADKVQTENPDELKAKIYTWAVHDAISRFDYLPKNEQTWDDKFNFWKEIGILAY